MSHDRDRFVSDDEMAAAQGEIDLAALNARPDVGDRAEPTEVQRVALDAARVAESWEILDEIAAYRKAFGDRWAEAFRARLDLP